MTVMRRLIYKDCGKQSRQLSEYIQTGLHVNIYWSTIRSGSKLGLLHISDPNGLRI